MTFRKEIWTFLTVTAVTIVIWFLAAGETRSQEMLTARLHLKVAEDAEWIVSPEHQSVQIGIEGSRLALDQAREVARRGITLELPAVRSRETIDLLDLLRESELAATGISITSIDTPLLDVERDEIVGVRARVRAPLPGVQTEGEIIIEPGEVSVAMPSAMRDRIVGELTVEAYLDRTELERLQPGIRHDLQNVKLRLSETLTGDVRGDDISISPDNVKLSFAIRSRTREILLDSVRVQLGGPPEDHREYLIDFEDTILRNVTITAEGELIRRIESNEVRVVAMLHLESREKEQRIASKPITYFLALVPERDGNIRGQLVQGRIGEADSPPPIARFTITRKAD